MVGEIDAADGRWPVDDDGDHRTRGVRSGLSVGDVREATKLL